jgi:adhesin transport system outer membrane protein
MTNYKKVSLMDVVLETVSNSDLLKASREQVIQSEIKLKDAIAGYYPTFKF